MGSAAWASKRALTRSGGGFEFVAEVVEDRPAGGADGGGEVPCGPKAIAGAGFVGLAGAGVEGMAVDAEKADLAVVVKDVLGSGSVMDVPIDDEHAVKLLRGAGVGGGDGNVVEEAKAHRLIGQGVVPGRATEDQGDRIIAGADAVDGGAGGSGG